MEYAMIETQYVRICGNMDKNDIAKQLILDYQETFGSECGKRVRDDLKKRADFDYKLAQPIGTDGQTDPYRVMHREGKRCILAYILGKIQKDPNERNKNG